MSLPGTANSLRANVRGKLILVSGVRVLTPLPKDTFKFN
jgi:hypothetical protein